MELLEIFRDKLKSEGNYQQEDEIASVVQMLDSPLFRQIIAIQDSLKELKKKSQIVPSIGVNDFDFSPTGELVFQPGMSTSSSQVACLLPGSMSNCCHSCRGSMMLALFHYLCAQSG